MAGPDEPCQAKPGQLAGLRGLSALSALRAWLQGYGFEEGKGYEGGCTVVQSDLGN
ncbi:hypothetical protein BDN67DRAFT_972449 [Paxillus ammoniavirescens]|nr:hypothetical protein BDN67DRAFT_972449 [Paxillus ammoniavirescens]